HKGGIPSACKGKTMVADLYPLSVGAGKIWPLLLDQLGQSSHNNRKTPIQVKETMDNVVIVTGAGRGKNGLTLRVCGLCRLQRCCRHADQRLVYGPGRR